MPRGDRTGPSGMGPMTGRGMGCCNSLNVPGSIDPPPGRGSGRGRRLSVIGGRGSGRGAGRLIAGRRGRRR